MSVKDAIKHGFKYEMEGSRRSQDLMGLPVLWTV